MELSIEKFSPTTAELTKLAEESKSLSLPDPFDQAQLRKVKDARLTLRDARVAITKTGKVLREDALKFQKAVIAKEKELVAIVEPEETRLADLEAMAESAAERKAREELLPHRKERLEAIGDGIIDLDDRLLDMDGPEFESYINIRIANKNNADRAALEARERAIRDEEARQTREQEMRDREEKARQEERERLEREKKDAEDRAQRQKEFGELQLRETKKRLQEKEQYQTFLRANGYTEATQHKFHIEKVGDEIQLYELKGIFKLN